MTRADDKWIIVEEYAVDTLKQGCKSGGSSPAGFTVPVRQAHSGGGKTEQDRPLDWPENLLAKIDRKLYFPDGICRPLNEDQMEGLLLALGDLKERERLVINMRFEGRRTYREIGEALGVSSSRARQILAKAFRRIRNEKNTAYIREGYHAVLERRKQQKEEARNAADPEERLRILSGITLLDADLPVHTRSFLSDLGILTLGQLVGALETDPNSILIHWPYGDYGLREVFRKLEEYKVDCSRAKTACGINPKAVDIGELELTIRTYNALHRAGFDKVEDVLHLIQNDMPALRRVRNLGAKSLAELFDRLEVSGFDTGLRQG